MPNFLAAPAKLPASTARTNPTTPRMLFTGQHSKLLVGRDISRAGLIKRALRPHNLATQTATSRPRSEIHEHPVVAARGGSCRARTGDPAPHDGSSRR